MTSAARRLSALALLLGALAMLAISTVLGVGDRRNDDGQ